jgi:hypothetical protein
MEEEGKGRNRERGRTAMRRGSKELPILLQGKLERKKQR